MVTRIHILESELDFGQEYDGSYCNLLHSVQKDSKNALDVVYAVLESFPSFNDEILLDDRKGM